MWVGRVGSAWRGGWARAAHTSGASFRVSLELMQDTFEERTNPIRRNAPLGPRSPKDRLHFFRAWNTKTVGCERINVSREIQMLRNGACRSNPAAATPQETPSFSMNSQEVYPPTAELTVSHTNQPERGPCIGRTSRLWILHRHRVAGRFRPEDTPRDGD